MCVCVCVGTLYIIDVLRKAKERLKLHLFLTQGDIQDYESVYKAFHDIDCVFHAASFGMSGVDQVRMIILSS